MLREEQRLDQLHSFDFFIHQDKVNNSDDFVLTNKYKHFRSSLFIHITFINLIVPNLFIESILGINKEVK